MRNKKNRPLSLRAHAGWMGAGKKSPLTRGMSRLVEPIDELVESVAAGVTGGSKNLEIIVIIF